MKYERLEGEPIPATLDEIEYWRSSQIGIVRAAYFAGKHRLVPACHLIEDINRTADNRRQKLVDAILYRRAAA